MLNKLKRAVQRLRYGYDDSIFWGFDAYFEQNIMPPLKEFCLAELEIAKMADLNPKRNGVYAITLQKIQEVESEHFDTRDGKKLANLAEYFGKNIGYYWD